MKKYVYFFGNGKAEGRSDLKDILGGKGANLAEMTNIGLPVPPGFTISTEACIYYHKNGKKWPEGLRETVTEYLKKLEDVTGKTLGDINDPLLVSVRSGAKISMPGMMDTVLNLGMNDESVKGLSAKTHNERFAYDCYRRFIQMFGNVVKGIESEKFEEALDEMKEQKGAKQDTDLTAEDLKELIVEYKKIYKEETGEEFPQEPKDQLFEAINAVFDSWNNKRAITYRKLNKIPDDLGTAVNVQSMVFGNMGNNSATGVSFTRNPSTGEKEYYGEYLINAQGEDVVAGIRTPKKITDLENDLPEAWEKLKKIYDILEKHYRDMQDFEFTIQEGKVYMLQTRTGKRTGKAAVKIAYDMVHEGLIDKKEAVMRVLPDHLDQLLHRQIDPNADYKDRIIATGLPASPGAATGKIVFSADDAEAWSEKGEKVILVRTETTPEDIHGMIAAQGILTARGGMTSHAAVVARGMGKTCVAGCEAIKVDTKNKQMVVGNTILKEGDWITIDGTTGNVISGQVPTIEPKFDETLTTLLSWADELRHLEVWTNADTPKDAQRAREFGAQGIGLCRTEHMFFEEDRIPIVREMIMADNDEDRKKAVDKLLPIQRGDFYGILKAMNGLPVTIRLLDPPLHEFLPPKEELQEEIIKLELTNGDEKIIKEKKNMLDIVKRLSEFNPMLGHRGCRLGITYPVIYEMQVRAIFEAACQLKKEGMDPRPEVMIPLVGHINELKPLVEMTRRIADEVIKEYGADIHYMVGTMIEIPRAALTADEIATSAEFFSFGTNDLTQMTFGFSRDDAGKFLGYYVEHKILPRDPFQSIDQTGVGRLMRWCVESGKRTRPELKIGICGEHGGEPDSIEFCHLLDLNYVSCSPYRVPIARLAAAQAAIKHGDKRIVDTAKKNIDLKEKTAH